jgi:branched-chain amino acid transport system permease protein
LNVGERSSFSSGGDVAFLLKLSPRARAVVGSVTLILPLLVLALLAGRFSPATQRVVLNFFVFLVAAVGLAVYSGNSGILSFGHAAFMGIGAYCAGLLTLNPVIKNIALPDLPSLLASAHASLTVAIAAALLLGAIVGYLSGLVISLLGGPAAAIATLAFLVIVNVVLVASISITRGPQTFYGITGRISMLGAWLIASLVILAARLYRDSVRGLQLRASREDELAARSMGVDVRIRRLRAWVLSAAIATMSGAMLGVLLAAFSPKAFYFSLTFAIIVMIVVGGMSTVSGAVGGAAVVAVATEILRRLEEGPTIAGVHFPEIFGLTDIALSLLILAMLIFRPSGLFGRREPDEALISHFARKLPVDLPAFYGDSGSGSSVPAAARLDGKALSQSNGHGRMAAEAVRMVFGGLAALDGVSIHVDHGEILGLIGPNGSGKTTLLNVISGIQEPTSGSVYLGDSEITGWPAHRVATAGISRTFQNIRLFPSMTVLDNVKVGVAGGSASSVAVTEKRARAVLAEMSLTHVGTRMAGTLPYGEQRRVEIARALAMEPDFLLFDEPAAGMNDVEADELNRTLAQIQSEYGVGMIVVEHKLRLVLALCQRVAVLDEGKLITVDVPSVVEVHPGVVEAYIGRSRSVRTGQEGRDE